MFSKLTINSIAARAVLTPMPRPVRTASGDILAAPLALVDVQTNEGIVGRGYAFAYTPLMLRSLVQFLRDVAPELVGQAVSPRERMRQLDKRFKLVGWQGGAGMAIGALDMALWDALGRAANLPVAVLLGGEVKSLDAMIATVFWTSRLTLPGSRRRLKAVSRRSRLSSALARWRMTSQLSLPYGS